MNVRDFVMLSIGEIILSPNAAWTHMNALKRHGLITWQSGQARTIRPTEAGVSLLEGGGSDG